MILPSYQYYLEREHHLKGTKVNESEVRRQKSTSGDNLSIHSREVLLVLLNKKKKLSFDAEFDPKHHNYDVQIQMM